MNATDTATDFNVALGAIKGAETPEGLEKAGIAFWGLYLTGQLSDDQLLVLNEEKQVRAKQLERA